MSLDFGVGAVEFDGCLSAGDGIDRTAKDVSLGVAVDVAGGLLDFIDLGFSLKVVEEKYAGVFGKAESGGDLWEQGLLALTFLFQFLVELNRFRGRGAGSALLLIFFSGGPIDERVGKFLPIFALGAVIADAVALHFILVDELVGAILEDEAADGAVLGRTEGGEGEKQGEERQRQSFARREDWEGFAACCPFSLLTCSTGGVELKPERRSGLTSQKVRG